jgi:DNA polymerase (family 10)
VSLDRAAVAGVLDRIAEHLEFKGENPFRVRAFRTAAKAILGLPGSVEAALADGSLAATRGIGPATLAIVRELAETGRSRYLEELRREVPPGLLEMAEIPGLGFKRVRAIHQTLGIATLDQLEAAARDGRLGRVPGLGARTADKVLKGIAFVRGTRSFRLGSEAAREAEAIRAALAALPGVERVAIAGDLRRRADVVGELVFVADLGEGPPAGFAGRLETLPGLAVLPGEGNGIEVPFRTADGGAGRVLASDRAGFGSALVRATGSPAHLALLEARAAAWGLIFEGPSLRRGETPIATPEEADCYRALGLPVIPPELREGLDEVALAERGALPRLVERSDLTGLLHCHSTWSDGKAAIAELAVAGRAAGYDWLGLSDHSQSAAYAGGLRPEDVRRQWDEIGRLAGAPASARILRGIESDILRDGRLDYEDDLLAGFDFVIGSVHSRLAMEEPEMTERLLAALEQPALTILGHPTGRLLLAREPFRFDHDRIFRRAAERGVALEINGDPHRLDLDWRLVRRARELGATIALGADAHDLPALGYQENALAVARKAGLTRDEVLNCRTGEAFLAFAKARRR